MRKKGSGFSRALLVISRYHIFLFNFYDQTECPQKENLFIPVDEAKELMKKLAREVYGDDKPINIHFIPGKKAPRQFGFLNPVIAWLSKLIRAYR